VASTDIDRPKQFLADLMQAMGEAARTARQDAIDQCKSDAQAYSESLHAGTSGGAGDLHRAAVADVRTLREHARAAEERVRVQTAERIARREQRLVDDLTEYQAALETEVQRVGLRVQAFEAEVAEQFKRLLEGTDPSSLMSLASRMPSPPSYPDPDPHDLIHDYRQGRGRAHRGEGQDRSVMNSGTAFAPRTHARPRSG
jgi:hypothetical protein